jgi:transposase
MDRAPLPDLDMLDRDALVALLLAHQEELAAQQNELRSLQTELDSHRQMVSEQAEELHARSQRIEHMKLMIDKLRQMMFGKKSEKVILKLEQLEFELEEEETTQAVIEAVLDRVSPAREAKPRHERKPLPEHLEREVITHVPGRDCCPDCGAQLRKFGEDISEQLEYVPDSFKVIRHVRPKFSCTGCDRVVEAPAPSRPIERGLAGPALLAHVIVSKFSDHLPLYRQSEIYSRQGVDISRSTLAGWVGGASDLLGPLVMLFRSMCSPAASCMPTTLRCLYWLPETARLKRAVSGHTCATTGQQAKIQLLPFGSPTLKIARANIRASI